MKFGKKDLTDRKKKRDNIDQNYAHQLLQNDDEFIVFKRLQYE